MKRIKCSRSGYDCAKDLEELHISYKKNKKYIQISDVDFERISSKIALYIDFDIYSRVKGISGNRKYGLSKKIEQLNGFVNIPEARILNKKLISVEMKQLMDKKQKENEFISAYAAKKEYGLKQSTLDKCTIQGCIRKGEEGYCLDDIICEIEKDRYLITLEQLIENVERQLKVKIIKSAHLDMQAWIVRNEYWGRYFKLSELVCNPNITSKKGYCFEPEIPYDEIKKMLVRNSEWIHISCHEFIWENLSENEALVLNKKYGIDRYNEIPTDNAMIYKIICILLREDKDITELTDGDVNLIIKDKSQSLGKEIYSFFSKMLEVIPYTKYTGKIRKLPRKTQIKKVPPYSFETYIRFGAMIFSDEEFEKRKEKALESSACAQLLFFSSMMYCAAWRTGDIERLCAPLIDDIEGVIRSIKDGTISDEILLDIYVRFEYQAKKITANKNGQEIEIYHSDDFDVKYGAIIAIAEYWRISDERLTLFNRQTKLGDYIKLFGDQYREIFGNKLFSERRLNKDYLMVQVNAASRHNNLGIRSLPAILAAVIRGHKIDLEKGQKTIFNYIDHSSEGLSVDEVLYELFEIGTMGHYKEMVGEILFPDIKNLRLDDRSEIMQALRIDPIRTEKQIHDILIAQKQLNISEYGLYESYETIIKKIRDSFGTINNANESNVYCMFSGVTGYRKTECVGSKYCTGDEANGLCPYGIYFREYIFNLIQRLTVLEDMEKQYKKELVDQSDIFKKRISQAEIARCGEAIRHISKTIEDFLETVSFSKETEKYLITIITEA